MLGDAWNWEKHGDMTPDECAQFFRDMLELWYADTSCSDAVEPPYWDDTATSDDTSTTELQTWYGAAPGYATGDYTFVERLTDWAIAGFIAYAGNLGGAVSFLTFAPKFRLAWKKGSIGGVIRVIIDGIDQGLFDTSGSPGEILEHDFSPPGEAPHSILQVLVSAPPGAVTTAPDISAPFMLVRKRLQAAEVDVITDMRQSASSGQLEMFRAGAWIPVPTANNVRVDGSVGMTGGLEIVADNEQAITAHREGDLPVAVRLKNTAGLDADYSVFIEPVTKVFGIKNNVIGLPALTIAPNAPDRTIQILNSSVIVKRVFSPATSEASAFNVRRNGAAAPGVGYGVAQTYSANDTAAIDRVLAQFHARYLDTNTLTYRAELYATAQDVIAAREGWRISADGANPRISFLGATPQVRQVISGSRQANPAVAALLTAFDNFGLIDDLTTEGTAPLQPTADLCRYSSAVVRGMWQMMTATIDELESYKAANPSHTYIQAATAVYPGIAAYVSTIESFTMFVQQLYPGDELAAFQEIYAANLDSLYCPLWQNLISDYIGTIEHNDWINCLNYQNPYQETAVLFMVGMMNISALQDWGVEFYASTPPLSCLPCDECGIPVCGGFVEPFTSGLGDHVRIARFNRADIFQFPTYPGNDGAWSATGGRTNPGCVKTTTEPVDGSHNICLLIDLGVSCTVTRARVMVKNSFQGAATHWVVFYDAAQTVIAQDSHWGTQTTYFEMILGGSYANVRYIMFAANGAVDVETWFDDIEVDAG